MKTRPAPRRSRPPGELPITAYIAPTDFVAKMIDAGESKVFMSTRDTVIRAFVTGATLALTTTFAVTITVQTGRPLAGVVLFPVGFCMLYLLGFDTWLSPSAIRCGSGRRYPRSSR